MPKVSPLFFILAAALQIAECYRCPCSVVICDGSQADSTLSIVFQQKGFFFCFLHVLCYTLHNLCARRVTSNKSGDNGLRAEGSFLFLRYIDGAKYEYILHEDLQTLRTRLGDFLQSLVLLQLSS